MHLVTPSIALAVLAAGCGQAAPAPSPAPAPAPVENNQLMITGYAFNPARLTVTVGTQVVVVNRDRTSHTVTSTAPGFDTGTVAAGHSASLRLRKPGTYQYYCQFHPFMHGQIIVTGK